MTLAGETVQGIGYSNEIAGGFAQFMPLGDKLLLPVPNGLPADRAALTEPIAVGWHAVQTARLSPDDLPLVVGCGPVGLAVIAGLAIHNIRPIIAADFSPARRDLALKMGADIAIDPAVASPYEAWRQTATPKDYDSSRYAQLFGLGPKLRPAVIFECVGVPGVIQQIMEEHRRQPASSWWASACRPTSSSRSSASSSNSTSSSCWLIRTEFSESLQHIAEGKVDVTPLITGTVGLAGVNDAFAELANPERHAKVIVDPWV